MTIEKVVLPAPLRIAPAKAGFALASILAVAPVQAVEFELMDGEVSGALDTTLSYGSMWRVQGQDKNNDGINSNDGNRNYDTGLVSQVFKITSDLELNWENYGAFFRGTAFYDTEMSGSTNFGQESWHQQRPQPSQAGVPANRFLSETKDLSGRNAEILDAYVYGSWDVGDVPVDARFGKQVLSWGEGIFYRGGINTTNPIDAAKFRLPGSELKEALIPVETFSLSFGLTDNLSADVFYQYNFRKTEIDPVGTYFSETDLFAAGGNTAYTGLDDTSLAGAVPGYIGLIGAADAGVGGLSRAALASVGIEGNANLFTAGETAQVARIGQDINANDDGQFGISFRYIAEDLNDTEFGFYFVNYHNKEPVIYSSLDESFTGVDVADLAVMAGGVPNAIGVAVLETLDNVEANRKYLEDIRVYGFSFSTTYGNTSFAGEIAYRPNLPIGIATTDDLLGDLIAQAAGVADTSGTVVGAGLGTPEALIAGQTVGLGGEINNYERVEAFNLSLSAIHNFGPRLSFDSLFGIVEVASEHLRGSNLTYSDYLGRERKYSGRGNCEYVSSAAYGGDGTCDEGDQITRNAWGYSAILAGTWNDAYAGVTLNPYLRWSQDIKGNSHMTGNFLEGSNSMTIGMTANYLDVEAGIQYTEFTGPSTYSQRDRDNIGINLKYSF